MLDANGERYARPLQATMQAVVSALDGDPGTRRVMAGHRDITRISSRCEGASLHAPTLEGCKGVERFAAEMR